MDAYQITSLIFLGILVVGLIALIVIVHKAIVRHQASTDAQSKLLGRLVEVESALKSALPALERNTGNASKYLGETLPAIERNTGAAHKYLADSLPATAKAVMDLSALAAARLPALQESAAATERSNAEILRGLGETAKTLAAALALLDILAKTHGDEAVRARSSTLHKAIVSSADALHEELRRTTSEIAAMRKDLGEAVKF